jgi:hypothetical protein
MNKADIFRLSDSIKGFANVMDVAIRNNHFFAPPHPGISEIKDLVNHIINSEDEDAIKAINPLLERKEIIGQYYLNLIDALTNVPIINLRLQEWNDNNPDSNLKFEGYDNTELNDYAIYLSALKDELRTLSKWLESKDENPKENAPATNKSTNRRGRKISNFRDCITDRYKHQADDIIKRMHDYLDSRSGKDAAIVVIAAMKNGYIEKPKMAAFYREFGDNKIDKEYFNNYLDKDQFPDMWRDSKVKEMQQKIMI